MLWFFGLGAGAAPDATGDEVLLQCLVMAFAPEGASLTATLSAVAVVGGLPEGVLLASPSVQQRSLMVPYATREAL